MNNKNYDKFLAIKDLINNGQCQEALGKLRKLCANEPENLIYKLELGKLETNIGNFDKARKIFVKQLSTSNKNYATLELGRLEAICGNVEEAKSLFLSLNSTKSRLIGIYELAKLEKCCGNIEKARQLLLTLLSTSNKNYAILELGRLEAICGNIDEARKYFTSLLSSQYKNYANWELLKLEILVNDYTESLFYLKQLLKNNNFDDLALLNNYEFYIKYKLGMIKDSPHNSNSFNQQIVNYSLDTACEFVESRLRNPSLKNKNIQLNNDIEIVDLFDYAIENITDVRRNDYGLIDKYIFDYGYSIGNVFNQETSKFEVVTLGSTYNIINMYPILNEYQVKYQGRNTIKTKKLN